MLLCVVALCRGSLSVVLGCLCCSMLVAIVRCSLAVVRCVLSFVVCCVSLRLSFVGWFCLLLILYVSVVVAYRIRYVVVDVVCCCRMALLVLLCVVD